MVGFDLGGCAAHLVYHSFYCRTGASGCAAVMAFTSVVAPFCHVFILDPIVSAKKIKVKRYCYNMLLITKLRVFLTFLALKWIVKV